MKYDMILPVNLNQNPVMAYNRLLMNLLYKFWKYAKLCIACSHFINCNHVGSQCACQEFFIIGFQQLLNFAVVASIIVCSRAAVNKVFRKGHVL